MVDPTTTNKGYAVPVRGSNVGVWDTPVNGNFNIMDSNLGGVTSIALSSTNITLTPAQAQNLVIRFSGTLFANITVTFPQAGAFYIIDNQTTGLAYVLLTTGASGGQNIATQQGVSTDVYTDGTNFKFRNLGKLGEYWDYAGSSVPDWVTACTIPPYLNANGVTFSGVTYPYLARLIGTTLPDLRGRYRAFLNAGTGRITASESGVDGNTLLASGGAQSITLAINQTPVHNHTGTTDGQSNDHHHDVPNLFQNQNGTAAAGNPPGGFPFTGSTSGVSNDHTHSFATTFVGGNASHINIPPTVISGITMIRAA